MRYAPSLTPAQRAEARLDGLVVSEWHLSDLAFNDGLDYREFTIPARTERSQLVIVSQSDVPIVARPTRAGGFRSGILLASFGTMLVIDARHEHDLVIVPWHVAPVTNLESTIGWLETWRDTQHQYEVRP